MCLALLGPGDTAVVPDPAFPIHVYAVALAEANVISVPLGNDQDFLNRIQYLIEHLFPRPKLLVLNYPHNPSAMVAPDVAFYEEVVQMAKRLGFLVLHDFAYGETCFDDYRAPSFLQARGAKDVAVEFTTMSKPYNMAGWRVGFCAGNAEMCRALMKVKGYYDYGIFQSVQIASILALREGDAFVRKQSAIYQQRRDTMVRGLVRLGWGETESPKAGMFVWAKVAPEIMAKMGTIDLAMFLMERGHVAVAPGRAFGPNGEGYLRLALVENDKRINQAIRQMARALKETSRRRAVQEAYNREHNITPATIISSIKDVLSSVYEADLGLIYGYVSQADLYILPGVVLLGIVAGLLPAIQAYRLGVLRNLAPIS